MAREKGFIVIDRSILDWEWYSDINVTRLFIHLLLKANYKETRYQGHVIPRGSLVVGRKELALQTGISEQSIRTALKKLESTGEITIKSTNKFSVINVENWGKYQDLNGEDNQQINHDVNQQSTNNQPTTNQQLTTSKPINQETNKPYIEKSAAKSTPSTPKKAYGEFGNVLLTDEEYGKVKSRIVDWEKTIENLSGYMASTGKKYKSHYSTLLTWARRDNKLKSSEDVDLIADTMFKVPIFDRDA